MSDDILRIIPGDPRFVPTQEGERLAVSLLRAFPPKVKVTSERFDIIQFVDQGANFERVLCPHCHAMIPQAAWASWMDCSYSGGFANLKVRTPCCNRPSDLNSLVYEWPAGFASFKLEALNPNIGGFVPDEVCTRIAEVLGCEVRQILAHY